MNAIRALEEILGLHRFEQNSRQFALKYATIDAYQTVAEIVDMIHSQIG